MDFYSRQARIHNIAGGLVISLGLYVASFWADALYMADTLGSGGAGCSRVFKGWEAFLFVPGVLTDVLADRQYLVELLHSPEVQERWLFSGGVLSCWVANPLFFTAIVALLLRYRHVPWIAAGIALLCAK